jgi:hypothetical protein
MSRAKYLFDDERLFFEQFFFKQTVCQCGHGRSRDSLFKRLHHGIDRTIDEPVPLVAQIVTCPSSQHVIVLATRDWVLHCAVVIIEDLGTKFQGDCTDYCLRHGERFELVARKFDHAI